MYQKDGEVTKSMLLERQRVLSQDIAAWGKSMDVYYFRAGACDAIISLWPITEIYTGVPLRTIYDRLYQPPFDKISDRKGEAIADRQGEAIADKDDAPAATDTETYLECGGTGADRDSIRCSACDGLGLVRSVPKTDASVDLTPEVRMLISVTRRLRQQYEVMARDIEQLKGYSQ